MWKPKKYKNVFSYKDGEQLLNSCKRGQKVEKLSFVSLKIALTCMHF